MFRLKAASKTPSARKQANDAAQESRSDDPSCAVGGGGAGGASAADTPISQDVGYSGGGLCMRFGAVLGEHKVLVGTQMYSMQYMYRDGDDIHRQLQQQVDAEDTAVSVRGFATAAGNIFLWQRLHVPCNTCVCLSSPPSAGIGTQTPRDHL